jgi:asparagine synthase (glutamine-hydrolysing)
MLLHRRLSILDTTEAGWQPMSSADGRFHIVFNGEIYNFVELREELRALGHRFSSRSDTEVLLAAIAQWGRDALPRLVGMFAFAVLDLQRSKLLLARDFFGIKPLYYSSGKGVLRFASEIKALFEMGHADKAVNAERLLYYVRYGMTDFGADTMFSAVKQLPPAHSMEVSIETGVAEEPVCFWKMDAGDELDIGFDEAACTLQRLFLRSVELHLRSDVPLGIALSGGIDSSSIAASVRHLNPSAEIHAFSFISEEKQTSEEHWIDLMGKAASLHVHKVRSDSGQLRDRLVAMAGFHDEPGTSTSMFAQYEVFRAARDAGIKVMLDGQGADELLAGYRVYQGARLATHIRRGQWLTAARFLRDGKRRHGSNQMNELAFCADHLLPDLLQQPVRRLVGKEAFPSWLNRRWFAERGADVVVNNHTAATDVLKDSLARSVRMGLPSLLRYEDRNSMASSVESRVPFLTPELATFIGRLPESYLIAPDGTTKAVFRKAMRGIVPDEILDRRDKIGFSTPERLWLTELDGWVQTTLDSDEATRMPFLNLHAARKDWRAIRDHKKPFDFRVWRCLSVIQWSEQMQVSY